MVLSFALWAVLSAAARLQAMVLPEQAPIPLGMVNFEGAGARAGAGSGTRESVDVGLPSSEAGALSPVYQVTDAEGAPAGWALDLGRGLGDAKGQERQKKLETLAAALLKAFKAYDKAPVPQLVAQRLDALARRAPKEAMPGSLLICIDVKKLVWLEYQLKDQVERKKTEFTLEALLSPNSSVARSGGGAKGKKKKGDDDDEDGDGGGGGGGGGGDGEGGHGGGGGGGHGGGKVGRGGAPHAGFGGDKGDGGGGGGGGGGGRSHGGRGRAHDDSDSDSEGDWQGGGHADEGDEGGVSAKAPSAKRPSQPRGTTGPARPAKQKAAAAEDDDYGAVRPSAGARPARSSGPRKKPAGRKSAKSDSDDEQRSAKSGAGSLLRIAPASGPDLPQLGKIGSRKARPVRDKKEVSEEPAQEAPAAKVKPADAPKKPKAQTRRRRQVRKTVKAASTPADQSKPEMSPKAAAVKKALSREELRAPYWLAAPPPPDLRRSRVPALNP